MRLDPERCRCWMVPVLLVAALAALAAPVVAQPAFEETGMEYRVPDPVASSDVSALSTSSFDDWYRYPAEERYWLRMSGATAYTRDVLAGGQTFIGGATDGEQWTADALTPDGRTLTWGAIRFYSSYGGNQNCFVSPFWSICGGTSLYVLWYTSAQCAVPGTWTMSFYANGSRFHTGTFELLPRIAPGKVPLHNQGAYSDAYDTICRTGTQRNSYPCDGRADEVAWTIAGKGCAMTSEAMVLGYHGVSVDPATLNTWLTQNQGYDRNGNVYWQAVSRYARTRGVTVSYLGPGGDLDRAVCQYGPQIVSVRNRGHWVAVTGEDDEETTHLINDPNGGVATTLAARYGNQYGQVRRFGGPEYVYTDMTGIVIRFHSPGELLIADPLGRITGLDPRTGQSYGEIPGASYGIIALDDDETGTPGHETRDLDIPAPAAGEYVLQVVGTGAGSYDLEVNTYDPQLNPSQAVFTDLPINAGEVHTFAFDFQKSVGAPLEVTGGFDGGGQRPRDVNKFLSYGSPGEAQTHLPSGTTQVTVMVFYGETVLPGTFSASLGSTDVTALFQPTPGGGDRVILDLQPGRNVLKLSIDGELPTRVATDADRLVFVVP